MYINNYKYEEWKNKKISVEIYNIEKIEEDKKVYRVRYDNNYFLLNIDNSNNDYQIGDKISILCNNYSIKKDNNPYEFDYKRYLNSNNIVSILFCNKVIEINKESNKLLSYIGKLRNSISEKLQQKLEYKNSNLIKSLMYGDDSYIDKDLKNKFIDIGLGHILCVSGTHISFLLIAFNNITKTKKISFFNIFLLVFFYIFSLFKASLLRPILMYIISFFNNKLTIKQKLAITYLIILIINPYYLFNIEIIFSFLSILGINIFYSIINSWLNIKIKCKNKVIKYILSNISLTISSQILIIPFQLYYFQKLSFISIFSNLVICFTLNLLMYFIFVLFILFFIPIVNNIIIFICGKLTCLLICQINFIYKINYFNISLPKPNIFVFICFYSIIFLYLHKKFIVVYFWKKRNIVRKVARILNCFCIIYIFYWYISTMYFEKYIIFFNVGQGNLALLHYNTIDIVIDIGSTKEDKAGNTLNNYLKAKNIKNIDMILVTHMHSDHINGIGNLIDNNIKIKCVAYSKPFKEVEEYTNLKNNLKDNNIAIMELFQNDNIKIGKIDINILTPPKYDYINDSDMLNANSTVYLITVKYKNYLFMGDSTKKTERYILNKYIKSNNYLNIKEKLKSIYAYQVSHHGSNTSSLEEFISELNIKYGIFSAKKSVYGHPSDSVLELFKKYNYTYFITEKNGAIML